VRLGRVVWLVVGPGLVLAGCFYVDPINRRPEVTGLVRLCDDADPSAPCDFDDLHRGDTVRVTAELNDPDGPESACVLMWRILACDSSDKRCDKDPELYKESDSVAGFTVPGTLKESDGPVQLVEVTVNVYDARGASSSLRNEIAIKDGPTLALTRPTGIYAVGAPIDMFATYGDPDNAPHDPAGVTLEWKLFTPGGTAPPPIIKLEVPQNAADPDHVTEGVRFVPLEIGKWDVRVTATNAQGKTNDKALRFTVGPGQ
jgi:hypothetical protein